MRSIFQNKALTFTLIFLLAANLGLLVYFSFFKDRAHKKKRHVTEFVKRDLQFDDNQLKQFETIKLKNKEKLKELFKASVQAKDSFYQLILIDDLDDSLLFDKALVVADKQREIDMELFRQFKKLQSMCTPEQLARFDSGFMKMVKAMYRSKIPGSDSIQSK